MKKIFLLLIGLPSFYQTNFFAQEYVWHSYAYTGYAWSKKAGFTNPDITVFRRPANGNDDNFLRDAPFGGMALHRTVLPWLDLGFSYDFYAIFAYQKFHQATLSISPPAPIEFLTGQYQRQFSLQHQSAMVECFLKMPQDWRVMRDYLQVRPLIGGAVGVGINNLFGFQTIYHDYFSLITNITSIAQNHISKSFAWRFEGGVKFESLDSNLSFGISYRYYDGGQFSTGTKYMMHGLSKPGTILNLPAWKGTLKTNQIKLYININFD
jgi:hypothetical protein